jgi:hypothetical protein
MARPKDNAPPGYTSPWGPEFGPQFGPWTPMPPPPNWEAERAEMLRKLDRLDEAFRQIAPLMEQIEASRKLAGLGHNQPPEGMDGEPLSSDELEIGIAAANVFRVQLSYEQPDFGVIHLCGLIFKSIGAKIAALARWAAGPFAKGLLIGTGEFVAKDVLAQHSELLHEIVTQIHQWF